MSKNSPRISLSLCLPWPGWQGQASVAIHRFTFFCSLDLRRVSATLPACVSWFLTCFSLCLPSCIRPHHCRRIRQTFMLDLLGRRVMAASKPPRDPSSHKSAVVRLLTSFFHRPPGAVPDLGCMVRETVNLLFLTLCSVWLGRGLCGAGRRFRWCSLPRLDSGGEWSSQTLGDLGSKRISRALP